MTTRHRNPVRAALLMLCATAVMTLAGCGGGDGGGGNPQPLPPLQPPAPVTQMISAAAGGTINGPGGVALEIPAGALSTDTAITIALDDTGAPSLPPGFTARAAPMVALTPHDLRFAAPVRISLPAPTGASAELTLLKTNEGRQGWRSLPVTIDAGRISASITSFSNVSIYCCLVSSLAVGVFPKSFIWNEGGFALLHADAAWAGHREKEGVYATYQWLRDGLPLAGETLDTILLDPLLAADNGAQISVRVQLMLQNRAPALPTPILAPVTSTPVTLQVRVAAPVIVNQPSDAAVTAGQSVTFTAASTSSVPQALSWRRCDDPARTGTVCPADCLAAPWTTVMGATSNSLTIGAATLADDGDRFALLAANAGAAPGATCSRAAGLTVTPAPTPPAIIGMVSPGPLFPGDSGSLTVSATGSNLSYRWETQPPGAAAFTPVQPAVNAATYTVSSVTAGDNGTRVRVVVSNSLGSVTLDPPRLLEVRPGAALALTRLALALDASVALAADGGLYAWGEADSGVPANDARADVLTPARLGGIAGVATVSAGTFHAAAITGAGSLYLWGGNSYGQLGDATIAESRVPRALPGFGPGTARGPVVDVAAGSYHTIAATADGRVWTWGANPYGQLGNGTSSGIGPNPAAFEVIGLTNIAKLAANLTASAALDRLGRLWVWGYTGGGLGANQVFLVPTPVPLPAPAVDVALGANFAVVLLNDGRVVTWGLNGVGQLGSGDRVDRYAPAVVNLRDVAVGISVGLSHVLVLLADGTVMSWGSNQDGQVGDGTTQVRTTPVTVSAPLPATVRAIGAGVRHSLALDATGRVWAWGDNRSGQLGNGTASGIAQPVPASIPNLTLN